MALLACKSLEQPSPQLRSVSTKEHHGGTADIVPLVLRCAVGRLAHMVNLMPREPQPQDEGYRDWLLARLDFLRSLVESGADCALEDGQLTAHDGRPIYTTMVSFYADTWIAEHRSRRQAG